MKRLTMTWLAICCTIFCAFAQPLFIFAAGNNTVIVFEGAKQEQNKVTIDVSVKENSGVYSMLLTLDYDISVFTLESLTFGEALSALEPVPSKDYSIVPYKISFLGKNKSNDFSTGKMMTLTFIVNENAEDGDYYITFDYAKKRDVTYLSGDEIKTKNLIISGAKITLQDCGVKEVITANKEQNENSGGLVSVIIAASVAVVCIGVLAAIIIIRKRRSHKWKKI